MEICEIGLRGRFLECAGSGGDLRETAGDF